MTMKKFLSPRNDVVFKRLFGDERNTDILTAFLKSALTLPADDYEEVTLVDPHLRRESLDDKLGILDVKVKTRSGKIIDIEIQVSNLPQLRERIVFYLARMITEQIGEGDSYKTIQRSISILIADHVLISENQHYHNCYTLYDPHTDSEFTNLLEVNTLELPKLPENADGTVLWDWLKFLDARNEEELTMLADKNLEVKKAVGKLMELSSDEQTRLLAESREKLRRDIDARERGAKESGWNEAQRAIARNALNHNMSLEDIAAITGLPLEEIRTLH